MKNILLFSLVLVGCISFLAVARDTIIHHQNRPIQESFIKSQNEFVVKKHAEWASVQQTQNHFDWSHTDKIYQHAKRQNKAFKWVLEITPEILPQWLENSSQSQVKANLLGFVDKICERYEKINELSLETNDQIFGQHILDEVSNIGKCNIIIDLINKEGLQTIKQKLTNKNQELENKKGGNKIRQNQGQIKREVQQNKNIQKQNQDDLPSELTRNLQVNRLLQTSVVTADFNLQPPPGYTISVATGTTSTNGATITSVVWDWGDNTATSNKIYAAHQYAFTGSYNVTLTATDSNNNVGTKYVTVNAPATINLPVASFRWNATKQAVFFNATASKSKYGTIKKYKWEFGNGIVREQTVPTITYTYSGTKIYNITLTITDDHLAKGSTSNLVSVTANEIPTCDFDVIQIVGYAVFLESTSTDNDGYIMTYKWNWDDGSDNDSANSVSHIYTVPKNYNVTLIVVDENGGQSLIASKIIQIPTNLPIAKYVYNVTNLVVNFNATSSVSPLGSIIQYKWYFGDNNVTTTSNPVITHTYSSGAVFNVTLQITDNMALTSSISVNITTVSNVIPIEFL